MARKMKEVIGGADLEIRGDQGIERITEMQDQVAEILGIEAITEAAPGIETDPGGTLGSLTDLLTDQPPGRVIGTLPMIERILEITLETDTDLAAETDILRDMILERGIPVENQEVPHPTEFRKTKSVQ